MRLLAMVRSLISGCDARSPLPRPHCDQLCQVDFKLLWI